MHTVLAQTAGLVPVTDSPAPPVPVTTGGGAGGAILPMLVLLIVVGLACYLVAVWRSPAGWFVPERLRRNVVKAAQKDIFDQVRRQTNDQISKGMLVTLPALVVVTAAPELVKRLSTSRKAVIADLIADIEAAYNFAYDDEPDLARPNVWLEEDEQARRLKAKVYFIGEDLPSRSQAGRTVTAALARPAKPAGATMTRTRPTTTADQEPATPDYEPATPDYEPATPDYAPATPLVLRRPDGAEVRTSRAGVGGRSRQADIVFNDVEMLSRKAFTVAPSSTAWTIEVLPTAKHGVTVNGAELTAGRPVALAVGDTLGVNGFDFAEVLTCSP